ncbi:HPF/RaiA family ribosome-associated protein [Yoonia sp.]|uniref:HPF/RaiA family ribosome-associated protein n=1 Tax=Yoonia sp. TaxID=2212373 RepID=UPI003F6BB986
MQTPLEITFRDVTPSDEIKALVAEKVRHLETFYDGIISCHVIIQAPHQSQKQGNLFEVTIYVLVPGEELAVRHNQHDVAEHEHLRVALRDAFSAMARKVKRWKDAVAGEVKVHDGPLQGRVVEIHHDEGYGQIIATDHRLVYFHKNSVVDGSFDALEPRDTVELVVQTDESDIGPQASTVRKIGALNYDPKVKKRH